MILKMQLHLDIETIYIMFFEGFLGVPVLIADSDITDIDNVSYSYIWTRFTSNPPAGTIPSGLSTVGSFLFHVTLSQRNKVQVIINHDCSHVFVRTWWGTAWMEWKAIV